MRFTFRRYNRTLAALVLLPLLASAFYEIRTDPYWLWHEKPAWFLDWGGHNRALDIRNRFAKSLQVVVRRPEVVLLGSSRVYRGIDTGKINGAYNLGISGLRIREAEAYLRHTLRWTGARRVILGLDYFMFDHNKPWEAGFDRDLGRHVYLFKALPAALLTLMAYRDSGLAVSGEHAGDGFWTYSGFKSTKPRDREDLEVILSGFYTKKQIITAAEYASFETVIDLVGKAGVELDVFISPMNARQVDRLRAAGEAADFDQWRKRLIDIGRLRGLTVHDFSLDNPFFGEEVINGSSPHWIDTSHYAPSVGDWLLGRLEAERDPESRLARRE